MCKGNYYCEYRGNEWCIILSVKRLVFCLQEGDGGNSMIYTTELSSVHSSLPACDLNIERINAQSASGLKEPQQRLAAQYKITDSKTD